MPDGGLFKCAAGSGDFPEDSPATALGVRAQYHRHWSKVYCGDDHAAPPLRRARYTTLFPRVVTWTSPSRTKT